MLAFGPADVVKQKYNLKTHSKKERTMQKRRLFDSRIGYLVASVGALFGVAAPAAIPAFASAATLTSRSVALSTSEKGATADYKVTFTPTATFDYVVIDWCDSSTGPIPGDDCTAPAGLKMKTGVTLGSTSPDAPTNLSGTPSLVVADEATEYHTVLEATPTTATSPVSFTLKGVTNPSATGTFYARIYTYTTAQYSDEDNGWTSPTAIGETTDTGGAALAINDTVGVTAAVREKLQFCVAGDNDSAGPTAGCADIASHPASLNLGEGTGDLKALDNEHVSTGVDWAQISTNAVHGAVVNLKSSTTGCGGLVLTGTSTCGIQASGANDDSNASLAAGKGLFGVKVGTAVDASAGTLVGTLDPAGSYGSSDYFMDYVSGDGTGVTGPYGSPLLNTNSAPASNVNVPLTFGASVSPTTPAGKYSATLTLIATGTF